MYIIGLLIRLISIPIGAYAILIERKYSKDEAYNWLFASYFLFMLGTLLVNPHPEL